MAIDPTTPLTPIIPAVPAGVAPDSVPLLQAMARAALANTANQLGEIVGRTATTTPQAGAPVEQVGQTSTQDAGHAADAPSAKGASIVQTPPAVRTAPETRQTRAVRAAAAEAVPRQTGLAPLMANVRAALDRSDTPIEVRVAGRALLARAPAAAEITTSAGLRRAVERSGVFLEARMARAAVSSSPETPTHPSDVHDLKAALLVFRGALSAWLAKAVPQVLDIEAGEEPPHAPPLDAEPERSAPTQVAPGRQASAPTVGSSLSTPATPPGAALDQPDASVERARALPGQEPPKTTTASGAGILPETAEPAPNLAQAARPNGEAAAAPPAQSTLEPEIEEPVGKPAPPNFGSADEDGMAARFGSFVAAAKPPQMTLAPARAAVSALVQLGLMAEEANRDETPTPGPTTTEAKPALPRGYGAIPAEAARPKVPPPPYAGGPMAGQKPTPAEVPVDISTTEVVRRLLKGTGGALARQDLMQIASLPEPQHHHEPETAEVRQQAARLNLDLPFVTPQGVAVAQFEISHDGGGSGGGAVGQAERTYKARFSIDLEPLGPVHALVTLTGARARVSLWAERAETIARLRAGEESLGAALRQAELTPEVAVHSGAPSAQGGSPLGHFVDQAS